ncbi:MAG: NADH-quinone oxidoreductase subunit NuoK [Chloroflexota bacterium]
MSPALVVLGTSAALFALGATGVTLRRNPVAVLLCVEVMLNAANLVLVLASRVQGNDAGQAAALIVLVVAAAEAVIGLGLAIVLFRHREPADVDEPRTLRG